MFFFILLPSAYVMAILHVFLCIPFLRHMSYLCDLPSEGMRHVECQAPVAVLPSPLMVGNSESGFNV